MNTDFPNDLNEELVEGFVQMPRGSTHPHCGTIGGVKFVLKCPGWGDYSANAEAHVANEAVADQFMRAAGLAVPDSRLYHSEIGNDFYEPIRLARFIDAKHFGEVWWSADSKRRRALALQVAEAYPVLSLMAAVDTFKHTPMDNLMVDANDKVWFVDNGAMFGFRARGGKLAPEHYAERTDPRGPNGFFWLRDHDGEAYYCQRDGLPDIFAEAGIGDEELLQAATRYDFKALVETLPDAYRTASLMTYVERLQDWVKGISIRTKEG